MGNRYETRYPAPYVGRRTFPDHTPLIALARLEPRKKRPIVNNGISLHPHPPMTRQASLHEEIRLLKRERDVGIISPQECDRRERHLLKILEEVE